jgi:hypothetical protein
VRPNRVLLANVEEELVPRPSVAVVVAAERSFNPAGTNIVLKADVGSEGLKEPA